MCYFSSSWFTHLLSPLPSPTPIQATKPHCLGEGKEHILRWEQSKVSTALGDVNKMLERWMAIGPSLPISREDNLSLPPGTEEKEN